MYAPADYALRALTPSDEPVLWEMLYQALSPAERATPAREILQRPEYAHYVEGWGRTHDQGYVAYDKNEKTLLGAVWLRASVDCRPDDPPPELALVVKSGHRQRGIGASLLTQLVRANPQFSAVLLQVGASSPAVRLFERFGFEVDSQTAQSVILRRAIA